MVKVKDHKFHTTYKFQEKIKMLDTTSKRGIYDYKTSVNAINR
jgi:hypothetical protein